MLVNLDKFELLYFINGCAIGSHLRQGIWKRCVDEFYGKLNDKERAFIYQFSLRDFWEIMAMAKYPNVNKEYPRFGFDDYKKFLACYNPNNRYNVKFEGVPEGKKKVKKEEANAYLYDGKYWIDFQRYIPNEYITSAELIIGE